MPICYVCESSLALPKGVSAEECNLSIDETIQKAEEVAMTGEYVYTMSPFFLQSLVLFADQKGVLNRWYFILLHDNGSKEDKTDKREDLFAMMTSPLDRLFMVPFNEDNE